MNRYELTNNVVPPRVHVIHDVDHNMIVINPGKTVRAVLCDDTAEFINERALAKCGPTIALIEEVEQDEENGAVEAVADPAPRRRRGRPSRKSAQG